MIPQLLGEDEGDNISKEEEIKNILHNSNTMINQKVNNVLSSYGNGSVVVQANGSAPLKTRKSKSSVVSLFPK